MIDLVAHYAPALMHGLGVTALLTAAVWILGVSGGILLGLVAHGNPALARALRIASVFISAVPVLVLLMWLHFPAQALLNVVIDPAFTTVFTLSVVDIVFVADVVSRTIDNLPKEWTLAARVSGLDAGQISWRVTLPLAARQVLGPITFIQVSMLQATLFGSLISVDELFRTVQQINAIEYRPIELYTILAGFFLVACAPLQVFAAAANKRFSRDLSLR